jgi:large subunit ribosomal protein L25
MTVTLPIQERTNTKKGSVDVTTNIPGVVYGPKQAPIAVTVDRKGFEKVFKTAGESTVIELTGLVQPMNVLVKDVAFAPTKGGIMHVDFYAIEKGKEVETHVPLHFTGEAPAAKLGAVVNKVLHEVTVSCQPADLPAHIDVDLSLLTTVESKITVADIVRPKGVKIKALDTEIVAIAEAVTEEAEAVPEAIDMASVEVEKKGKTEEDSAA